jgi:endonuclease/exonuclease/phosphatase family metal-dependent hydrolase
MATNQLGNGNLSKTLEIIGKISEDYVGNPNFLDLITWNIRWFNDSDKDRVQRISDICTVLSADIFVFQEVRDKSLETVVEKLNEKSGEAFTVVYGTTGGDQRIAIMYNLNWVKAKDDITELFGKKSILTASGQDAFPRLPLWGYFKCRSNDPTNEGFTFQLAGLHMKSQMGGGDIQRRMAAEKLAFWLEREASYLDSDVILLGDWNESPSAKTWSVFHNLEKTGDVQFEKINDESDFSHLYYKNKNNIGSRLDIVALSSDAAKNINKFPKSLQWYSLSDLLKNNPMAKDIKAYIKNIKDKISDHFPVYSRFYMVENH